MVIAYDLQDCRFEDGEEGKRYHTALFLSRSNFEGFRTVPIGLHSDEYVAVKESKNPNELVRASLRGENIPEKLAVETQSKA